MTRVIPSCYFLFTPVLFCSLHRAFRRSRSAFAVTVGQDRGTSSVSEVMDGIGEGSENLAAFLESVGLQSYHDAIRNELKVC